MSTMRRRISRMLRPLAPRDPVLACLGALLLVYYAATPGIFQGKASGDGFFGFMYLPGLILHRSLDLAAAAPEWAATFGREVTGRVANLCPVGPVLLWLPTYLLGLLAQQLGTLLGLLPAPGPHFGRDVPDFWMAGLGALLAGFFGIGLMFRVLVRRLPQGAARLGTVTAVLATPLTFYLVTQPLYQHASAFFAVTLFIERWDAWRGAMNGRRWAALGALGGLAMLMRQQEGLFLLLPALDLLGEILAAARRRDGHTVLSRIADGSLFLVMVALVYAPQLALWYHYYGRLRVPQAPGHFRFHNPAIVESIFSMRSGLLPWVPVLYLVPPGLILWRRRLRGLLLPLALVFALELLLNASVWDYHGCWSFGPRRYTDATLLAALGLGGLYAFAMESRRRTLRALLIALSILAVGYNLLLMELVRQRKVKSSGAGAFYASTWVMWAGGPPWLQRALDRLGYPFVQPAGWIYALLYDVPIRTFEGVVGNYILERDWRVRGHASPTRIDFSAGSPYVVEGESGTGPRARVLVPLFEKEPLRIRLVGELGERPGEIAIRWNGHLQRTVLSGGALAFDVPARQVHTRAWTNELVISRLPPLSRLRRLEFESLTRWWIY